MGRVTVYVETVLLAAFVMLVPLILTFTATVQLPHLIDSGFRSRVWTLRDNLADQVLRGDVDPSPAASALLAFMEFLTESAGTVSFAHLLTAAKSAPPPPARAGGLPGDVGQACSHDAVLSGYVAQLDSVLARQLRNKALCQPLGLLVLSALAAAGTRGHSNAAGARIRAIRQSPTVHVWRAAELAEDLRFVAPVNA